jgi:hypothetical protein
MSNKFRTEFFNKNLFLLLIAASLVIHVIIIFLSPQANQILSLRSFRDSFIREPSEYAVTLELENADARIENVSDSNTKQDESTTKKEEDDEKKKQKIFADTSENTEDTDVNADTDKIGEKGSVAKDNFPDDKQPVNNEPHAEGRTKAPLLGKGRSGIRYANLPKGLEKQESPPMKPLHMIQPQVSSEERKVNTPEIKTIKTEDSTHV